MTNLTINDLNLNIALDQNAMTALTGGGFFSQANKHTIKRLRSRLVIAHKHSIGPLIPPPR